MKNVRMKFNYTRMKRRTICSRFFDGRTRDNIKLRRRRRRGDEISRKRTSKKQKKNNKNIDFELFATVLILSIMNGESDFHLTANGIIKNKKQRLLTDDDDEKKRTAAANTFLRRYFSLKYFVPSLLNYLNAPATSTMTTKLRYYYYYYHI